MYPLYEFRILSGVPHFITYRNCNEDTRYILIMTTSCAIILNDNLAKLDFSSCATWKNVMLTLYGKINIIISVSYYFKYALVYNTDSIGSTPSSEEKDR